MLLPPQQYQQHPQQLLLLWALCLPEQPAPVACQLVLLTPALNGLRQGHQQ
jgi:hypothetical protein